MTDVRQTRILTAAQLTAIRDDVALSETHAAQLINRLLDDTEAYRDVAQKLIATPYPFPSPEGRSEGKGFDHGAFPDGAVMKSTDTDYAAVYARCLAAVNAVEEDLKQLLTEWAYSRSNAVGRLDNHYPIDSTMHGYPTEPENAWGCNTCGRGWPCLVVRTTEALAIRGEPIA